MWEMRQVRHLRGCARRWRVRVITWHKEIQRLRGVIPNWPVPALGDS